MDTEATRSINSRSVVKSREVTRDGEDYATVTIPFNQPSEYLSTPPPNGYATSLTIRLPADQEVTPLETKGINIKYEYKFPTEIEENGQTLTYVYSNPSAGQKLVPINPETGTQYQIGQYYTNQYTIDFSTNEDDDNTDEQESFWDAIDPTSIQPATRRMRDGRTIRTWIASIPIKAKQYLTIFKLSKDSPNGYCFSTIYNGQDEQKSMIVELPEGLVDANGNIINTRGWKDWIRNIYKGACVVSNVIKKVDEVTGGILGDIPVVGQVWTTATTVTNAVKTVGAPLVDLIDGTTQASRAANALRDGSNGPVFTLYNRTRSGEPDWNSPITPGEDYEITDEMMTTLDSEVFEPIAIDTDNQMDTN